MDQRGLFVASILDSSAKVIAAAAANRQLADSAPGDFATLAADNVARLRHLSESLAAGTPALFVDHVEWTRDAYVQREVPLEVLDTSIRCLRDEVREALPDDARDLALTQFEAAMAVLEQPRSPDTPPLEREAPLVELTRKFLLATLEARRSDALNLILEAAEGGADLSTLELEVIARAQAEVGTMWHRGEIQIAEEHMASGVAADALSLLRQRIPLPAPGARRVIVASVGGNTHDLGARIVADHFALGGWDPVFLGSDTPIEDVVWAAREFNAQLVALSATLSLHVRVTAQITEALHSSSPSVRVLVGGPPFTQLPDLWKAIGADGSARDAVDAVRVAGELVD